MITDLSKLRRTMVYSWELFYSQQSDGTRILRHIRVNNTRYQVPLDGITVDGVTLDADILGTEQIKDGSIKSEDFNSEMFATDKEIEDIFAK